MRWTHFAWLLVAIGCDDSGGSSPDMNAVPDGGGEDAPDAMTDGPAPMPACSDGDDNDSDGLTDFPNDPNCDNASDDDESETACDDGADNDGDGLIDGTDPGCSSTNDDDELDLVLDGSCGADVGYYEIGFGATVGGSLGSDASAFEGSCGGSGAEVVYHVTIDEPNVYAFSTVDEATMLDTIVHVRTDCADAATEVGCNDEGSAPPASTLLVELEVGDYFIFVDASSAGGPGGPYVLHMGMLIVGGCKLCDPSATDECAPGLLCREDVDFGPGCPGCFPPVCSDETDDDGDGLIDYPDDPGCDSLEDGDESDSTETDS